MINGLTSEEVFKLQTEGISPVFAFRVAELRKLAGCPNFFLVSQQVVTGYLFARLKEEPRDHRTYQPEIHPLLPLALSLFPRERCTSGCKIRSGCKNIGYHRV